MRLLPQPSQAPLTAPDEPCWRGGGSSHTTPSTYLVIQHEQQGALHIDITRTLHLEAISLLGRGQSVPLQESKG